MSSGRFVPSVHARLVLAGALALAAMVLFLLDRSDTPSRSERTAAVKADLQEVDRVVQRLFTRYGIRKEWVRTWQVRGPDRSFLRTERKVFVPPAFVSVAFNRDLSAALEGLGATAVATEHTRENTVTMHIKTGGTIIESITFVVKRDLISERKEPDH